MCRREGGASPHLAASAERFPATPPPPPSRPELMRCVSQQRARPLLAPYYGVIAAHDTTSPCQMMRQPVANHFRVMVMSWVQDNTVVLPLLSRAVTVKVPEQSPFRWTRTARSFDVAIVKLCGRKSLPVTLPLAQSDSIAGWQASPPAAKTQASTLLIFCWYEKGVETVHDEPCGWMVGVTSIVYDPAATLMNRIQRNKLFLPNEFSSWKGSTVPVVHTAQGASGLGGACGVEKLSRLAGLRPLNASAAVPAPPTAATAAVPTTAAFKNVRRVLLSGQKEWGFRAETSGYEGVYWAAHVLLPLFPGSPAHTLLTL